MDNNNFKSSIKDMNIYEQRGWIIDRIYQIESMIDSVITEYYKPKDKSEFEKVVLNSSIISLGGKLKILANLDKFDIKMIEKIRKIISIRNAFAHLPVTTSVSLSLKKEDTGEPITEIKEVFLEMNIMSSSGKLNKKRTTDLMSEFYSLNTEIREYFLHYEKNRISGCDETQFELPENL